MINGGTVNYWAIANFSRHREDAVGRFIHGLVTMCQNRGIVCICFSLFLYILTHNNNNMVISNIINNIFCYSLKVFNPQPLIPMYNSAPNYIEKALVEIHTQCTAQLQKVAPGNSLQLLFVILPDAKGTYRKSLIYILINLNLFIVDYFFQQESNGYVRPSWESFPNAVSQKMS